MMHEDGSYFLFYSASNYQLPSYRMMVARSGDLLGPYTKGEVPVVETDWDRCVAAPIVLDSAVFSQTRRKPLQGLLLLIYDTIKARC